MTAISGTTSTGFEYSIPEGLQTDWNFVRAYQKMMRAKTDMDDLILLSYLRPLASVATILTGS